MVFRPRSRSENKVSPGLGKKITAENILIARILVYSAIKISAKGPLLYSVLNPDTSSDSPSAKSNGVRLVSASIVINHKKNAGKIIRRAHVFWVSTIHENLRFCEIRRAAIRIKAILTS